MAGNAFIKLKGATGESKQEGFLGSEGWIEIGEWGWEIENESSWTKGSGAAVGKATPGKLNWSHYYDTSSPVIFRNITQGKHFDEVEIAMLKTTGGETPERYFTMKMKAAFITKATIKGGEDGNVNQDVEMVFKEVEIIYMPQKNDGTLGGEIPCAWNISTMKST